MVIDTGNECFEMIKKERGERGRGGGEERANLEDVNGLCCSEL